MMGPYTAKLHHRFYPFGDPDDCLAQKEADEEQEGQGYPICAWCEERITDDEYLERVDHRMRPLAYHEKCAEEWFRDSFTWKYR